MDHMYVSHFWFQHLGLKTRLDRKTTGCNSDLTVSHFPVKAEPLPPHSLAPSAQTVKSTPLPSQLL